MRYILLAGFTIWMAAAQTPAEPVGTGTLTVRGDIPAPLVLTASELGQMARETVSIPDPDGKKVTYEGVPLREIILQSGVSMGKLRGKVLATYVLARAHDGYEVLFSVGELDMEFGNGSVVVADKRDGKPLEGNQGRFRLVCPNDKAGARSVRMLETIEVVRLQK